MDKSELERELERLHADSFAWALACCGRRRDEAEDVLQHAYLKVLDGRARFNGRSSLKTWLFGVIRYTASEQRRSRFFRLRALSDDVATHALADPAAGADATLEAAQQHARLLAALNVLPRRQREVIELVFYHELTVDEAAHVMRVSVGSARRHYDRAKRRLRNELGSRERS